MQRLLLSQNMQTRNRKMPIPNQMAMHDKRNKETIKCQNTDQEKTNANTCEQNTTGLLMTTI